MEQWVPEKGLPISQEGNRTEGFKRDRLCWEGGPDAWRAWVDPAALLTWYQISRGCAQREVLLLWQHFIKVFLDSLISLG